MSLTLKYNINSNESAFFNVVSGKSRLLENQGFLLSNVT